MYTDTSCYPWLFDGQSPKYETNKKEDKNASKKKRKKYIE